MGEKHKVWWHSRGDEYIYDVTLVHLMWSRRGVKDVHFQVEYFSFESTFSLVRTLAEYLSMYMVFRQAYTYLGNT